MTKLVTLCAAAALLALFSLGAPARADNVELRIASLAPSGSPWMDVLNHSAADIKDKTNGRVTMKYFEGGQQGDERDFVR
jgi:TRAP-type C4-dicarboxylate transport system substrate-binding protein